MAAPKNKKAITDRGRFMVPANPPKPKPLFTSRSEPIEALELNGYVYVMVERGVYRIGQALV